MKTVLIAAAALIAGLALGVIFCETAARRKRPSLLRSVTRFLFVTTQVCAIIWVSMSYGIAAYSTVKLAQAFPVEELSRQAIITLLGMSGLKVVENIFEHNEGVVFGQSRTEDNSPDEGGEGGVG